MPCGLGTRQVPHRRGWFRHRRRGIWWRSGIREPINKSTMIRIASSTETSLRYLLCSAANEGNASQEPAFMPRDDGKILGTVLGVFGERLSNDCAALAETQHHRLRAAAAQPEILGFTGKTAGVEVGRRTRCRVGFKSKKSSARRQSTTGWHAEPIALLCLQFAFAVYSSSVMCSGAIVIVRS